MKFGNYIQESTFCHCFIKYLSQILSVLYVSKNPINSIVYSYYNQRDIFSGLLYMFPQKIKKMLAISTRCDNLYPSGFLFKVSLATW